MNYTYYLFAFYIFVLICGALLLYRYLFSDLKRQQQMLEEKETKLLRLYQTLEEVMDDFYDSVESSKAEARVMADAVKKSADEAASRIQEHVAAREVTNAPSPAPPEPKKRNSRRSNTAKSTPKNEEAPPFRELVMETAAEPDGEPEEKSEPAVKTRTESILELSRQGLERAEIARELNVTLSEVDLVIGINRG